MTNDLKLVIGYERSHYMLAEQQGMYELTIKILTPPGSLKSSVSLEVIGQSGNATSKLESLQDCFFSGFRVYLFLV